MDISEKAAAVINDILSKSNEALTVDKLLEPSAYRQPVVNGECPNLLLHDIPGCGLSFDTFLHLRKDSFEHVRNIDFLDAESCYFLDMYLKYDYKRSLYIKDFGLYKIVVVIKAVQRYDAAFVTNEYCIVAKLLLDDHNHLVRNDNNKPAILLFEENCQLFKLLNFHEDFYSQISLDSFDSSSNYSVVCKKYDHSIICKSYYSQYSLDIIPFKRLKFVINSKDYSADILLNYDETFTNYTQTQLVQYMATIDKEHFDLLAMYLI